MTNQIGQKLNPVLEGKAIVSLILGIISGISILAIILLIELLTRLERLPMSMPLAEFIFYGIAPFIGIIGIVFGISGLKSTKRKFAIVGIILCLIGLLVPLYYFLK